VELVATDKEKEGLHQQHHLADTASVLCGHGDAVLPHFLQLGGDAVGLLLGFGHFALQLLDTLIVLLSIKETDWNRSNLK